MTDALERQAPASVAGLDGRSPVTGAPLVTYTDAPPGAWAVLRDAWRARRLAPALGWKMLVKIIWGTKLGAWWLVLRPLMDTLGKALIFGGVLGVAAPGGVPYLLFMLVGLVAWRLFDLLVINATRSFDVYRKIMADIDFPLLLVPLTSASYTLIEIGVYAVVLLGASLFFLLFQGQFYLELDVTTLAVVPGLTILLIAGFGLGFWTSVLNGKARDTRFIIRYVLEFWLYLTPVVYPLTAIPPAYQVIASFNPMTAPVEMVKLGLLGVGKVELYPALWSVAFVLAMVVSGLWFFSREARSSVDIHGPDDEEGEDDERDRV